MDLQLEKSSITVPITGHEHPLQLTDRLSLFWCMELLDLAKLDYAENGKLDQQELPNLYLEHCPKLLD